MALSKQQLSQMNVQIQQLWHKHKTHLDKTGYCPNIEEYLLSPDVCNPYTHHDICFDFFDLFENPKNYIDTSAIAPNTEVAVVGAGCAGLAAANLLLKLGIKPIVYEQSERIGGRTFSEKFSKNPDFYAEMGAMRIPESQVFIKQLRNKWNLAHFTFPNPKIVNTKYSYQGKSVTFNPKTQQYEGDPQLAKQLEDMEKAWQIVISPITYSWANANAEQRLILWQNFVQQYSEVSIYQQLINSDWDEEQIALFYSLGGGTGGNGPFFESTFLEMVRIEIQKVEQNQYGVIGGVEQFATNLWEEPIFQPGKKATTSVKKANNGATLAQVDKITIQHNASLIDITSNSQTNSYRAAILTPTPRAIEMTMDVDPTAFSTLVWRAIRQVTLTNSQKTFVLTKTAFWQDDPTHYPLTTTLTDLSPAQIYAFGKQYINPMAESDHGVICLNYSWGDQSLRYAALNDEQRVAVSVNAIGEIYGQDMADKINQQIEQIHTINWETTYGYNGAWRMANPGQQQMHLAMLGQMMGADQQYNNGLYLAGEALSNYGLSGWIDGAIKTGMIAALSAIKKVGGKFK